jgi:hypothetical protein
MKDVTKKFKNKKKKNKKKKKKKAFLLPRESGSWLAKNKIKSTH